MFPCWSRCFFSWNTLFWIVVGGVVVGFVGAFGLCVVLGGIGALGGPLAGATVGLSCTAAGSAIGYVVIAGIVGFLIGAAVTAAGRALLCAAWCAGSSPPTTAGVVAPGLTSTFTDGKMACGNARAGLADAEAALATARSVRDQQKTAVDAWDARTRTAQAVATVAAAVLAATAWWNVAALAAAAAALAAAGAVIAGLAVASAADRARLAMLEAEVIARDAAAEVWRKLVASLCVKAPSTPTVDTGHVPVVGGGTTPNP